jgi:Family of unknown function (DUF5678)
MLFLRSSLPLDCIIAGAHISLMQSDLIDPAELDAYDAWVAEHLDDMGRQHPGKVIAVYRDRLIAVGDTYREVFDATKAHGITEEPFTMRVPTADEAHAVFPSVFPSGGA